MFKKTVLTLVFCLMGTASALQLTFQTPDEAKALVPAQSEWTPRMGRLILAICQHMRELARTPGYPAQYVAEFTVLVENWRVKADSACDSKANHGLACWKRSLQEDLHHRLAEQQ